MSLEINSVQEKEQYSESKSQHIEVDLSLQQKCEQLSAEYLDLFKPELGCQRDFELEVKFKKDVHPIFAKT